MTVRDSSQNFTYAKVIAILAVAIDHYFGQSILWVPSAIGLFVFAFSSGYFTARRYRTPFRPGPYWQAKLLRLGPSLLVINLFLLSLFVAQGKDNLWNLQTPFAMLGLSEIGRWLGLPHTTPFGHGLWFFSVLILFYIAYPAIDSLLSERRRALATMVLVSIATTLLHYRIALGYMLWYVIFAFVFGVFIARMDYRPPKTASLAVLVCAVFLMVAVNTIVKLKIANYPLLLLVGTSLVFVLMTWHLPKRFFGWTLYLSGAITEIYFIHTYVFVSPAGWPVLAGLTASVGLVIATALILSKVADLSSHLSAIRNKQQV